MASSKSSRKGVRRRPKATDGSALVDAVGDAYYDWMLEDDIFIRVRAGLRVERLPEVSYSKARRDTARAKELLRRLNDVEECDLENDDLLSLEVLRVVLGQLVRSSEHYWLTFPTSPMAYPFAAAIETFDKHVFRDQESAEHYLKLIEAFPDFIGAILAKLKGQERRGIILPRDAANRTSEFLSSCFTEPGPTLFDVRAERLSSLVGADAESFLRGLSDQMDAKVQAPVRSIVEYLKGEYLRKAPRKVGLSQYPGGLEYYRYLVRMQTGRDITPEEVHEIGLAEIANTAREIERLKVSLRFKGTISELGEFLETRLRERIRTPEDVGEEMMGHIKRIEPKIDEYFSRRPKAPYGVKRLNPELEGVETYGYYQEPTASDPVGYYRFNGSDVRERSLSSGADIIYHELLPGHHFEICLCRENEAIPVFRRNAVFSDAYSEGWAVYSSALAKEMGMYSDRADLFGHLKSELFMSMRLVVDSGMNAMGWSRAKATRYMGELGVASDVEIESESLRYSVDSPAQALAYKMGHLRIVELREMAKSSLGDRFFIKRFHDAVLGSGPLPLAVLEQQIERFVIQELQREPT